MIANKCFDCKFKLNILVAKLSRVVLTKFYSLRVMMVLKWINKKIEKKGENFLLFHLSSFNSPLK